MSLKYPNIEIRKDERGRKEYWFGLGDKKQKLYAGRLCNNIVQALARIVMSDGMLRVGKRYPVVGTVHDELLALVPDMEGEEAKAWVHAQMVKVPTWMQGIPLNADVGYHQRYGLAKG
jgi:DNA polymerase